MAAYTPIIVSNWCVISQRLTTKHGGWKPCLRFGQLNLTPLWFSTEGMTNSLLLCWPVGLFFTRRTSPFDFYYLLVLGLPSPLRVRLFSSGERGWLRRTKRRFRWGRRKFGLSRLPILGPQIWFMNEWVSEWEWVSLRGQRERVWVTVCLNFSGL